MALLKKLPAEIVFVMVVLAIPISAYKKPMSVYNVNEGSIGDLKTVIISNVVTSMYN